MTVFPILEILQKKEKIVFDDSGSYEWLLSFVVSVIHCGLPVLFAFLLWIFGIVGIVKEAIYKIHPSQISYKIGYWELLFTRIGRVLSKLNIPIFTKLYAFNCELKLFKFMRTESDDRYNWWYVDKANIEKEIEENQFKINISMIAEAAMESGFQVNFFHNLKLL